MSGNHLRELTASLHRGRERNSIVEGETERLVRLLRALIVEEVVHDLVPDREEGATCSIRRSILAIRASDTLGERT